MSQPVLSDLLLTGERVLLRPFEPADLAPAHEILHGCEEILRWLVWEGPEEVADLEPLYGSWRTLGEDGVDYHFAICERSSGRFVGCIGAGFIGRGGMGDLGYWLDPAVWGRGYMTEAVRLLGHLSFRHLDAIALYAFVFVGNDASRRLLERSGYSFQYLARGKTIVRGRPVDQWYLALQHDEWQALEAWAPVEERVELEG